MIDRTFAVAQSEQEAVVIRTEKDNIPEIIVSEVHDLIMRC